MFADFIKIAAKIALIAVITAAVIAIFAAIEIPNLDFTVLSDGLGTGLALIYHWVPAAQIVVPLAISMLSVHLGIILFEYGAIAWRWIFKVNE